MGPAKYHTAPVSRQRSESESVTWARTRSATIAETAVVLNECSRFPNASFFAILQVWT